MAIKSTAHNVVKSVFMSLVFSAPLVGAGAGGYT